ncbi:MAG: transporter substrate-binding domain-containing protein [Oligoflexia bacterium]|nr:transporter substrate-binding domain-containing protein [Oligoflexia bacterium]
MLMLKKSEINIALNPNNLNQNSIKRVGKYHLIYVVLSIFLFLLNYPLTTATDQKEIKTKIVDNYFPYTYKNESGVLDGYSVDIFKAVAGAIGLTPIITVDTWENAKKSLKDGIIDTLPMMASSEERNKEFDFTTPHTIAFDTFFFNSKNKSFLSNKDLDLFNLNIVVMKKDAAHDYLKYKKKINDSKLIFVDSLIAGVLLIEKNQADVMIMPKLVGLSLIKKNEIKNVVTDDGIIKEYNRSFCFSVKKGNLILREKLAQGLSIIRTSGEYDRIYKKWFGHTNNDQFFTEKIKKIIGIIISVILFLSFFISLWIWSLKKIIKKKITAIEEAQILLTETEHAGKIGGWEFNVDTLTQSWTKETFNILELDNKKVELNVSEGLNFILPPYRSMAEMAIKDAIQKGESYDQEWEIITYKGNKRWVHSIGKAIKKDHKIVALRGSFQDITDRKIAEHELKFHNTLLMIQQESGLDGILVVDESGTIVSYNSIFLKIWNIPAEIVSSKNDQNALNYVLNSLLDPQKFIDKVNYLYQHKSEKSYEIIELKNGKILERYSSPMISSDSEYLGRLWVFRDITESKRAEKLLRESERLLSLTGGIAKIGGWSIDLSTNELTWTKETYIIHEVPLDFTPTIQTGINFYHQDDRAKISELVSRAINNGEKFSVELRIITAKGNQINVKAIGDALKEDRKIVKIIGTFQDITERVKMEQERLQIQNQLFHSSKLASIGTLAAGIAHEINNPLAIISGYSNEMAELCKDSCKEGNPERIAKIKSSAERIRGIVNGLRTYARQDSEQIEKVNLHDCITETLKLIRVIYEKEGIKIETELKAVDLYLEANGGKIQQLIMNLLTNARDALLEGKRSERTIRIATRNISYEKEIRAIGMLASNVFELRISDNGKGIEKHILEKLFDPFFTTKDPGKGTGLGLSITHSIIESYGGKISVESEKGNGATFIISLPTIKDLTCLEKNKKDSVSHSSSFKFEKNVLVVDDEPDIRTILARYLKKIGSNVFEAGDGEEALKVILDNSQKIDVIITDVQMPKLSGPMLIEKIKELGIKQIKTIFITGGVTSFPLNEFNIHNNINVNGTINKPFNFNSIVEVLKTLQFDDNTDKSNLHRFL